MSKFSYTFNAPPQFSGKSDKQRFQQVNQYLHELTELLNLAFDEADIQYADAQKKVAELEDVNKRMAANITSLNKRFEVRR